MGEDLNLQQILTSSTSPATLEDLQKKGLKKVMVLNREAVKTLIAQAVELAIERRARDRVAEALRIESERGRLELERRIQEHERALSGQATLVADRDRLERELAGLRATLAEKVRALDEEKARLERSAQAELAGLTAAREETRALLERLREAEEGRAKAASEKARLEGELASIETERRRLTEETQALRARAESAEKAGAVASAARAELEARIAAYEQLTAQMREKPGMDAAGMEALFNRFKAGLTLELTHRGEAAGAPPAGDLEKIVSSVASRHLESAFREPSEGGLDTVTPTSRPSGAGDRMAKIREKLNEQRKED